MKKNILVSKPAVWLAFALALFAMATLLYHTTQLIKEIERKERASAAIIVHTTELLGRQRTLSLGEFNTLASEIISSNESLPVILVDENDSIYNTRNLPQPDSLLSYDEKLSQLENMKSGDYTTTVIDLGDGYEQTLYYGSSLLIKRLVYIRVLQIVIIALFAAMVYMIFARIWRRERDTIWRGLALETAHQLGTPITSLSGWRDLLLTGYDDTQLVANEMTRDIERLSSVAERFSQVGSTPQLQTSPVATDLQMVVEYLQSRLPKGIKINLNTETNDSNAPHNATLIRWAVENICKNAADAISDKGSIRIDVSSDERNVVIDITDTGKGMDATTRRRIFDTGYTTKKRGWGIGLALVKRIMTEYHHGKVFVLVSAPGKGTTFRLLLPRE